MTYPKSALRIPQRATYNLRLYQLRPLPKYWLQNAPWAAIAPHSNARIPRCPRSTSS